MSNPYVAADGTIDTYVKRIVDKNPNMLVPWWFIGCYTYEQGRPVISDGLFDDIAKRLGENWEGINHIHKEHLDREALKGSLGVRVWPERVKGAAVQILALIDKTRG